jgi:phage baseplate assembly protein W
MAAQPFSSDELLGRGWALPVRLDGAGQIALVAGPDAVAQSIWSILATAPGERVGQPEFGCAIHDLVFAPGDSATAAVIAEQVRRGLELWEPRIVLLGVHVDHDPTQALMLIRIDYRLSTAPGVHNLVFPFYLEGAG